MGVNRTLPLEWKLLLSSTECSSLSSNAKCLSLLSSDAKCLSLLSSNAKCFGLLSSDAKCLSLLGSNLFLVGSASGLSFSLGLDWLEFSLLRFTQASKAAVAKVVGVILQLLHETRTCERCHIALVAPDSWPLQFSFDSSNFDLWLNNSLNLWLNNSLNLWLNNSLNLW